MTSMTHADRQSRGFRITGKRKKTRQPTIGTHGSRTVSNGQHRLSNTHIRTYTCIIPERGRCRSLGDGLLDGCIHGTEKKHAYQSAARSTSEDTNCGRTSLSLSDPMHSSTTRYRNRTPLRYFDERNKGHKCKTLTDGTLITKRQPGQGQTYYKRQGRGKEYEPLTHPLGRAINLCSQIRLTTRLLHIKSLKMKDDPRYRERDDARPTGPGGRRGS